MKKFFEEKKRNLKFKLAGPGHKLSEQASTSKESTSKEQEAPKRVDTAEDQERRAAMLAAALQRTQGQGTSQKDCGKLRLHKRPTGTDDGKGTSSNTPDELQDKTNEEGELTEKEASAPGVFFTCPSFGETLVLSRPEWNEKIRTHINELKESDQVLGSILELKTFNRDTEADECVALIIRYLRNIIENPEVEKYRTIRMGNQKFSEKVLSKQGALDFLLAAGFTQKEKTNEGREELYLVFSQESPSDLEYLIHSLLEINGFNLDLYRDFKMFKPEQIGSSSEFSSVPDDFFDLTAAELKKQQQQRSTELERESMLMTKKMREMEKAKFVKRKALYTRIRVKLPNEYILQGTFSVKEKFRNLREFIDEKIEVENGYTLMSPPAQVYTETEDEKTFEELNLQPAVQLILKSSCDIVFKISVDDTKCDNT